MSDIENINLDSLRLHAGDKFPPLEPVIRQGNAPIMTKGNISAVVGAYKAGKTYLLSGISATFFGADFCGLSSDENGKLLYIDSEQSKADAAIVFQRIYSIMGWNKYQDHPELIYLCMREFSAEDRFFILKKALMNFLPTMVIVDGVSDLQTNTNDLMESTALVNQLMAFSTDFNCHICCVLHVNHNTDKARGHLGSELLRKSESILLITRNDGVSTISPQYCRHTEFKPFSFRVDESGMPVGCENSTSPRDNNQCLFQMIFSEVDALTYSELKDAIIQQIDCKRSAAEARITKARNAGLITQEDNGKYHLSFSDEPTLPTTPNTPPSDEEDLPY